MTDNPSYRSTNARVFVYKHTTQGADPEEYEIPPEILSMGRVSWTISPEIAEADFTIPLGNITGTSMAGGVLIPYSEVFLGGETSAEDFANKVSGAWCKIFIPQSGGPQTSTMSTSVGDFIKSVPSVGGTHPATEPTTWKLIFIGKIWKPERTFGNLIQFLHCRAIDIGGYANRTKLHVMPKVLSDGGYSPMAFGSLPDFNQKENGKARPNKSTIDTVADLDYPLGPYGGEMQVPAFNGQDIGTDTGASVSFWTSHDIVDTCIRYLKTQFDEMWAGIDTSVSWTDVTTKLNTMVVTVSARQSLWEIMNDACPRDKSLIMWWEYSGEPSAQTYAVLKVGFCADSAVGGYVGLSTVDYTAAEGKPVKYYSGSPTIASIGNDDYYAIRIETEPVNFVYTFSLGTSFEPGWDTEEEAEDLQVKQGGTFSKFYSRFILNTDTLYKISSSGIKSEGFASEGWGDSTAVGVCFSEGGASLSTISLVDPVNLVPFEQCVKISPTIPIGGETAEGSVANTPILFFVKNEEDDCAAVDVDIEQGGLGMRCGMKHLNNTLSINPDSDNFDRLKEQEDRDKYYITMMVEDTPPLYLYVYKDVINQEASVCTIQYPFKPTALMNNTVYTIDEENVPQVVTAAGAGVASLLDDGSGLTVQELYNDMLSYAEFYAKPKVKCDWEIGYINHDPLLAKFIGDMEIPTIIADPAAPGAEFSTQTLNTIVTKIIWDFKSQSTSYVTDFKNYIKG